MKWNHTLSALLTGAAVTASVSSVYAMPKGPCDPQPTVCCDEPKPGPFAFSFPKDVNLNCPKDFYVHVDGLLLQAKEDGLEIVLDNTNGTSLPITNGSVKGFSHDNKDYNYNPGVRAGLGFYLYHDAWSIDFDWTWLNITERKNYSTTGTFLPIWMPPIAGPNNTWNTVGSVWNVSYNTLDAILGKPYHVSRYFVLNPYVGVRAAWIDQHFSVHYGGTFLTQSSAIHHGDNTFWGFGTRAGVKSDWIIGKGWSLFGNVAAAFLFGHFEVDQSVALGAGVANQGYDLDYDFYQNVPNMELQVGIAWNKYFNKNRYRVGLAAAYEFHEWWDQLNMRRFFGTTTSTAVYQWQHDTVSRGNLTLNGFSLALRLDI